MQAFRPGFWRISRPEGGISRTKCISPYLILVIDAIGALRNNRYSVASLLTSNPKP